ncbi:hypothetical protein PF010_g4503 [Phytophthora fragariae]|uniref:Uncharacterized protein n=1 Tax=Phytophthora fragariae TaxID=53985 RepID=A0A6A4EJX4_9STRA|nr:hypothetical protein PF011_g4273 [Phytophthora fragariae]KAE9128435.1 hypothetical protein PF010_g4503 [Phytophthora fragariae]KAE9151406.1 hypothetical protein PF006_g4288 [Phytophthora fragariae]KAE9246926.1 hypothetical protein PF002_g6507 [Phytophthora fragariae]KAE9248894.1 hypothetical protein PF004_g3651 [Phytophthora fragariae]
MTFASGVTLAPSLAQSSPSFCLADIVLNAKCDESHEHFANACVAPYKCMVFTFGCASCTNSVQSSWGAKCIDVGPTVT